MNTDIKVVQYKIGPRIKQLREENELKQNELANLIGVDRTSLSSYENSKRIPDIFILSRIADIFDISLDNLVGRERDRKAKK